MHVTYSELRAVRRGDLLLRQALLGDAVMMLVETPDTGSAGTSLEELCPEAHWAVLLRGGLELARGADRFAIEPGTGFHVPAGEPGHRLFGRSKSLIAGIVPLDAPRRNGRRVGRVTPDGLGVVGFDDHLPSERVAGGVVLHGTDAEPRTPEPGRVHASAAEMGDRVFTRATFGRTSGYVSGWCDAAHHGIVLTGSITIEWEHDVEVVGPGDIYHCPGGPPGHRIEVADDAVTVDFTPSSAFTDGARIAEWRLGPRALAAAG